MVLHLLSWLGLKRDAARSRRASPAWMESLAHVRTGLGRINHVTEQDFLRVGEKLHEVLGAAQQMSQECTELVGFLDREQADRGAHELGSILDRAEAMARQAESSRTALDRML